MKKLYLAPVIIATVSLSSCYLPQNFDNKVQISRTGQYQIDIDTDVVSGNLLAAKTEATQKNKPITAEEMTKILDGCEKEFNKTVEQDAKKNKHIVSSKYLGECKGHLVLKYTGNIIKEKELHTAINAGYGDGNGFGIPLNIRYDAKKKHITITEETKGSKEAREMFGKFDYNGKLSIKTDGKVISENANNKPLWGLIGSYKWNVNDMTDPDAVMVISTSGI